MIHSIEFRTYRDAIAALPAKARYERSDLICERFRIRSEGNVDVYYAPFHRSNSNAEVAIVGLTPGWTQMELAYRTAREAIVAGLTDDEVIERVNRKGSFAGPMRTHLVDMLDGIGLSAGLGVETAGELFGSASGLAHLTSVISAPVFVSGKNYTGHSPRLDKSPLLSSFITDWLGAELDLLPAALIVPLGKVVSAAIQTLCDAGKIDAAKCLIGFPHPSGANGHREREYEEGRSGWVAQVNKWFATRPSRPHSDSLANGSACSRDFSSPELATHSSDLSDPPLSPQAKARSDN